MNTRYSFGFTLIELLITVVIIALLTGLTIPYFQDFSKRQELQRGVEQVRTDLRTVQNRAVSGVDRKVDTTEYFWWGISFTLESGTYEFCQGEDESAPACDLVVRERDLPGADLEVVAGRAIWFKMITGEVRNAGAITIGDSSGETASVTVSAGGRIE